jgi:DNA-binding NarL/FixJ family response regulator
MSVLLVDDSHEFLDSIQRLLADDLNTRVVGTATSARAALEMYERLQPDVVFMDLAMPDMNGLQATRLLKATSAPPHIVMMTCHSNKEYQIAAQIAGADAFVSKDELFTHLPRLIDDLIRRRSHADASPEDS